MTSEAVKTYATALQIAIARELYTSRSAADIEIDEPALTSVADDGVWVQAWVWVPNPEKE